MIQSTAHRSFCLCTEKSKYLYMFFHRVFCLQLWMQIGQDDVYIKRKVTLIVADFDTMMKDYLR
jgi:hypothetical protein